MTNTGALCDGLPVTPAALKRGLDLGLADRGQRFAHAPILVKDSCERKQQFTKRMGHPHPVAEKSISRVVADNLAYWMGQAEMTQSALAAKAGVSQKTVSNYLNPEQRSEGASGKTPSPKLEELDKIARALAIPVWQLVRRMTERERRLYEHIERAYAELVEQPPEVVQISPSSKGGRRHGSS